MKRFSLFNRNKKVKNGDKINEDFLLDQPEAINIEEDLDFFRYKNKNHETAEDAISIRSVDCKWNRHGMKRNGLGHSYISKSFNIKDETLSYRNLNIISEINESPTKPNSLTNHFSKSMIICTPNGSYNKKRWSLKDDKHSDMCTANIIESIVDTNSFQIPMPPLPVTTVSLASRHNSNSSTHSELKLPWVETEDGKKVQNTLSKNEIERQNIIYELLSGEIHSVNDLRGVIKNYKQPLETLKLITPSESFNIFYKIESIIPLYEMLIHFLENEKDEFSVIKFVGNCLLQWSDMLEPIINYCTHLYYSKTLLEEKRKEKDFAEFLECCSISKFSRKLDLWTFLDNPRTRLMKYPLLIERILKSTQDSHPDFSSLLSSLKNFDKVLQTLDIRTGEEMCKFYLEKLEFVDQNQYIQLVKNQKVLLLEGNMKIGRSIHFQKTRAFLFNDVLVFTKPTGEENIEKTKYIVYGSPLPTSRLVLENIDDGEIKIGSFRSTFSSDNGSKNVFRLTLLSTFMPECELVEDSEALPTYSPLLLNSSDKIMYKYDTSRDDRLLKNAQTILQVSQSEEKQLWLRSLRKVVTREIKRDELFQMK